MNFFAAVGEWVLDFLYEFKGVAIAIIGAICVLLILKEGANKLDEERRLSEEQIVECKARDGMVIYTINGQGERQFKDCRLPGR